MGIIQYDTITVQHIVNDGVARHFMLWYGTAFHAMVWHYKVRQNMRRYGISHSHCIMVLYAITCYGIALQSMVYHGTAWH